MVCSVSEVILIHTHNKNPMLQKSLNNDKENIKFILKNFWRLLNYKAGNVGLPGEKALRSSIHSEIHPLELHLGHRNWQTFGWQKKYESHNLPSISQDDNWLQTGRSSSKTDGPILKIKYLWVFRKNYARVIRILVNDIYHPKINGMLPLN